MDLQLCFMNAIVFLEVTIVFSMVRLYFLCDAIYNCSLKSHNAIIHKWCFSQSYVTYNATGQHCIISIDP